MGYRARPRGVSMPESEGVTLPASIDLRNLPPVTMPDQIVLRIEEALALLASEPAGSAHVGALTR